MKVNVKSDCRGWGVERVVKQIFKDRNIKDPQHFLNPTIDDMLPLEDLENIDKAAEIVNHAIEYNYKIALLFDTDSDGISSGSIIYRYLEMYGADVTPFIDRNKQHGLQKNDLERYKPFQLLIIVDSLDATAYLYEDVQKDSNIEDIIVLDHHAINEKVPYDKYITLVSSQRNYGNTELSGAGVCWKFCKYLDKINNFNGADRLVDLAAVGIVSDMMDMTVPENRYIANEGLKGIINPALAKVGGGFSWDSKAIAFSVAPLINSANRLDHNESAMKAFICDDNKELLTHVKVLKKCKEDQNKEIDSLMPDVLEQCKKQLDKKMMVVFIETDMGIAGLLGNKLLSKYKRPIVILKDDGDWYKGSMRAVGVNDFRQMINESKLGRSFGHELAASCDVKKENIHKFINYMELHLPDVDSFEEEVEADVWVLAEDIDRDYIDRIQEVNKISGTGFKPIKFYISGITDYEITDMSKGKHLVIKLDDCDLNLIQWNFDGDWEELEDAAMMNDEIECVCELQANWIGRNFMLMAIIDWMRVKE